MRGIEARLEALEEHFAGQQNRIAVIRQNDDGTWPPEPPGAALVIAVRKFGGAMMRVAERAEAERLQSVIASILAEHPQSDTVTAEHVLRALERSGERPLPSEATVQHHLSECRAGGLHRQ